MDAETMEPLIRQIIAWAQDTALDSVIIRIARENGEHQTLVISA